MSEFLLPFQTEFDPPEQAEGSLDPLGLYSIADALGVKLAPGVRERQSHPRYLTLALVGQVAAEAVADPESRTQPWLAYEWLVVRAMVHELKDSARSTEGIPGSMKVSQALTAGLPVCAETYLKTPTVFGFHGIYRVLGTKSGIFDADGRPLTSGYQLLAAWEKDQHLRGFTDNTGAGAEFRHLLTRAIKQGIADAGIHQVVPDLRQAVLRHLHPFEAGALERTALWGAITSPDNPLRREYAQLLTCTEGQAIWERVGGSEAKFHQWAQRHAGRDLSELLTAIRGFELLARALVDAFQELRSRLASIPGAADATWLGEGSAVTHAYRVVRALYAQALEALESVDIALQRKTEASLGWVQEVRSPSEMATALIAHHERTQKAKPPNGKRSWFDTFADGRVAIRPGYRHEDEFVRSDEFVHAYRSRPLRSFAHDVGLIIQGEES